MKKTFLILILSVICFGTTFAQWTAQTSGVTTQLTSVSAPDDNVAWISGYAGKVLRTTTGGTTWTAVTNPSAADNYQLFAIDANIALVTASPGATFVYRTTDGGTTWTQVFTQPGGFIDAIWMTSATNGFMYGDPTPAGGRWSLWKTVNGGVTWDSTGLYVPSTADAGWNNGLCIVGTNYWFSNNTNKVYYSSNSGTNWTTQTLTATGGSTGAVWFNSATNGFANANAVVNTTVNGGTTWTANTVPGTPSVSGITGAGNYYWLVRQANIIYATTNSGTAWTTEYTNPATTTVYNHIGKSRTGNRMWAVTNTGLISKSDGPTGIIPVGNQVPSSFSLEQNYPNPFNPATTIKFSIPSSSNVTVKIYDILGNEVMTVVNQNLQAGVYSTSVDASNLSSGVYFYTIKAGSFAETKKMSLIK